ncbi:unnamed protein product [Heligmosomoides polygyrus]|uniref:Uncharacterized protein n=1 Tax=Heligmosomoides polygyrus TaxID=6339 RepID=A0A183G1E7_HELPZ|nr:unnamed protein product [Heligmosomoides polygyrus]
MDERIFEGRIGFVLNNKPNGHDRVTQKHRGHLSGLRRQGAEGCRPPKALMRQNRLTISQQVVEGRHQRISSRGDGCPSLPSSDGRDLCSLLDGQNDDDLSGSEQLEIASPFEPAKTPVAVAEAGNPRAVGVDRGNNHGRPEDSLA